MADSEALNLVAGDGGAVTPSSSASSLRLPRRLRRRVVAAPQKSPITAEHIEAKLEQAHLRRKRLYELLSSRARTRERASSFPAKEEELNKRLEAKLNAAEQKRSSILERAQTRLAKLDELRKAAKADLETRFERERDELSAKVQSRAKKAEENRIRFLKAFSQRSSARRDRITQLITQKTIKERKYRDRIRTSICQKRAAAVRKRSRFLEEEKEKACAMILRVRQAVNSASSEQAEMERVEIMRPRLSLRLSDQSNSSKVQEQAVSKIIRCWRRFVQLRRTTSALAYAFESLGISEESVKSMSFEQLAFKIESPTGIQTTKALVNRLQSWYLNSLKANGNLSKLENIENLLRHVALPIRKGTPNPNTKKKASRYLPSSEEAPLSLFTAPRYPVRILLCSYVILGHPDAIFNRRTECENSLALSAGNFVREFELLLKTIKDGPFQMSQKETDPSNSSRISFRSQIEIFDKAWCSYLSGFVAWKYNDSKFLEDELVRAACELEISLKKSYKRAPRGDNAGPEYDSFSKQVSESHKLLREKLKQLSGNAGVERMEAALSEIRSRYVDFNKTSPESSDDSSGSQSAETSEQKESLNDLTQKSRASDKNDKPHLDKQVDSTSSKTADNDRLNSIVSVITENEFLVNNILHKHQFGSSDTVAASNAGQTSLEAKVRETLEKAFWDGVMESLKENNPDLGWILNLVGEVRDDLCDISPQAWKQEITDTIDTGILSQALGSGHLDMDYFRKILEFALVTLRKLSAPANDDDIRTSHNKFMKELGEILQAEDESKASLALAITKSLRFVLEQIQTLKVEISKARLRMIEPLIKGNAGLDYLRNAFSKRHGSPSDALTSLPITKQWISMVKAVAEEEWHGHVNSISSLTSDELSSEALPITLRTGGRFLVGGKTSSQTSFATNTTDMLKPSEKLPECGGEGIDLLIRLGLLKLVSEEAVGLNLEDIPETLELNLTRLRGVQHHLQKIIVVSTCVLILRQMLASENLITSPQEMDERISRCTKRLSIVIDTVEDAGLSEFIEAIISSVEDDKCVEKLREKKQILVNMMGKSLQGDDPVFKRVSHTVHLAARGVVLGGNGVRGRELAETSLRRIGAAPLAYDLVKAVEVLIVAATVTCNVHRPWYQEIINSV